MQKWIEVIFVILLIVILILLLSSLFSDWISKLRGSINQTVNSSNTLNPLSNEANTKGISPNALLITHIQTQKNNVGDPI